MESKVNYTIVGLFVIVLTALLIFSVVWLAGKSDHKKYMTYLVLMNESVSGLTENSAVKYNGVNIGSVKSIALNVHNPKQVRLLLSIEQDTPIKVDTRATLMSQGLTGLSYVNLTGGSLDAPLLKALPNEAYPVIKTEPSLMLRLDTTVRQLSITMTALSQDFRELLNKENRAAIKQTLHNLNKISTTLAQNTQQIDASIKSTRVILQNTAHASQQLPVVMHNLSGQILPQLFQTLNSLQGASGQLKELAVDLKQNPSMILRGRQPLPLGPGE